MPFLSSEQRKRAVHQHQQVIRLLNKDHEELVGRLVMVNELIKCNTHAIERIMKADEGDVDVDTMQSIDDCTRDTMMRGITHYPVVVAIGKGVVIRTS